MHGAASSGVRLQSASRTTVAPKNHLAPSAIHGLEVLSLPVTALDTYISKAVEQNPLLELDYATSDLSFGELSLRDDDQPESDLNYDSANWYSGHGDIEHNRAQVRDGSNDYRDGALAAQEGSHADDWSHRKDSAFEPRPGSGGSRDDSFGWPTRRRCRSRTSHRPWPPSKGCSPAGSVPGTWPNAWPCSLPARTT